MRPLRLGGLGFRSLGFGGFGLGGFSLGRFGLGGFGCFGSRLYCCLFLYRGESLA